MSIGMGGQFMLFNLLYVVTRVNICKLQGSHFRKFGIRFNTRFANTESFVATRLI